jgi:hypothetical protein
VTGTGTGTSWTIATYTGTLTGTFENVTNGYDVTYGGGMITLLSVSVSLAGDYNDDGKVDAADYVLWRNNVGAPAGTLSNDIDGGTIGPAQYTTWRVNFGESTGAGTSVAGASPPQAAVPEPANLVLLMFTAAGWCRQRRRAT